jgi:hypothetical protein
MIRRAFLKLSIILLMLTVLFYFSSSTQALNVNLNRFSADYLAYSISTQVNNPEATVEIFMPLLLNNYYFLHYTTSLYFNTVDPNVMSSQGCDLANTLVNTSGQQDSAVILDFCQPWVQSGMQGVWLCDDGGFAKISYSQTEDSVEEAAQRFAEAFYNCSYNYSDTLGVIIGTSNFGGYVSSQHGIEWANMINRVNTWLINQGYFYRVHVVGGSDMELGYNSYANTSNWVNGYESTNLYLLHDFGDAQGCPTTRTQYDGICGGQTYQWYQSQVWDISYNQSREAFPLKYNVLGTNAQQWYSLSAYSYIFHGQGMPILGAVTEYQACQDRSGCAGIDNTPGEGYSQLRYWLNQDPDTAYIPRWSTDFRHYIDIPH